MTVLQKESPEQILSEAIASAKELVVGLRKTAYNKKDLFAELDEAIERSGMVQATSKFIIGRHIEKPYLNRITAKGLYEQVVLLTNISQLGYLVLVKALLEGYADESAIRRFRGVVLFKGGPRLTASQVMPDLSDLELRGVLQCQEAAFFRMASEVRERILEQYRGTHG